MVEGAPEARNFLADSCSSLKAAFGCDKLLLQPPALGEQVNSAGGAKVAWCVRASPQTCFRSLDRTHQARTLWCGALPLHCLTGRSFVTSNKKLPR